MTPHEMPSRHDTIEALLDASGRRGAAVPLRQAFLQQGAQNQPKPGPLRDMLRDHDERALDLYLLHRALASSAPWDTSKSHQVWARALGLTSARTTGSDISKLWQRLDVKYRLVARGRHGRQAVIRTLCEDGSGHPYTYPNSRTDRYFKLPFDYWREGWHEKLSLRAKVVLLIGLSLKPPFVLPIEKMPAWYGISPDSTSRALNELKEVDLLSATKISKKAPLAPAGFTVETRYALLGAFHRVTRAPRTDGKVTP
jgi:hypothetical protein